MWSERIVAFRLKWNKNRTKVVNEVLYLVISPPIVIVYFQRIITIHTLWTKLPKAMVPVTHTRCPLSSGMRCSTRRWRPKKPRAPQARRKGEGGDTGTSGSGTSGSGTCGCMFSDTSRDTQWVHMWGIRLRPQPAGRTVARGTEGGTDSRVF